MANYFSTPQAEREFRKLKCRFEHVSTNPWVIYLEDRCNDTGTMSMTNDAEQVCKWAHIEWPRMRVMYKDTDGNWDEMVHTNGIFNTYKKGSGPNA